MNSFKFCKTVVILTPHQTNLSVHAVEKKQNQQIINLNNAGFFKTLLQSQQSETTGVV